MDERCRMAKGAVTVSSENRNHRVLIPFAVFAAEIVFDVLAPELSSLSLSQPRVRAYARKAADRQRQRWRRRRSEPGDDRHHSNRRSIACTSGTAGLLLSVHELVDDQRTIGRVNSRSAGRFGSGLAGIEVRRTLFEHNP